MSCPKAGRAHALRDGPHVPLNEVGVFSGNGVVDVEVQLVEGFVEIGELAQHRDGSEGLLAAEVDARGDIFEQRGLKHHALPVSAGQYLGATCDRLVDPTVQPGGFLF